MFGIFDTLSDFVDDPIGVSIRTTTQPLRDTLEIVDGLTEGELRLQAAARLGADIAGGMALNELVEWYSN